VGVRFEGLCTLHRWGVVAGASHRGNRRSAGAVWRLWSLGWSVIWRCGSQGYPGNWWQVCSDRQWGKGRMASPAATSPVIMRQSALFSQILSTSFIIAMSQTSATAIASTLCTSSQLPLFLMLKAKLVANDLARGVHFILCQGASRFAPVASVSARFASDILDISPNDPFYVQYRLVRHRETSNCNDFNLIAAPS
jgi:hypothetical protein